jgi:hypothetical protein
MNLQAINRTCFYTALGSIVAGAVIGIAAVWVEDLWIRDFTPKGLATTAILFSSSVLGALVTRLLVVEDK